MIYVLLYPATLWERLQFSIRGIAPSIQCDYIRNGPGIVECIHGEDACTMVPMDQVMRVVWESGYKKALETARDEAIRDMADSMKQMGLPTTDLAQGCNCGDDDEDDCDCSSGPYVPSGAVVDGYN
jgi:hypothetical protein